MMTYLEDGRCSLSNNLSEQKIKSYVIGRKGWLFIDSPEGAEASAISYSIAETALANGLQVRCLFSLCSLFQRITSLKFVLCCSNSQTLLIPP